MSHGGTCPRCNKHKRIDHVIYPINYNSPVLATLEIEVCGPCWRRWAAEAERHALAMIDKQHNETEVKHEQQ